MPDAPDRRSPFSTLVSLLLTATVALGSGCILSLLVSLGPAAEASWSRRGVELPLASRLAVAGSRLVQQSYGPVMAMTAGLHGLLLLLMIWAGRTPQRLLWGSLLACFVIGIQLMLMLWISIAMILPG
jgi:hypothetical protein